MGCSVMTEIYEQPMAAPATPAKAKLKGKRVGMLVLSSYPSDPRPRRVIDALRQEGMIVDLICVGDEEQARREELEGLNITRLPIRHTRGGPLSYAYQYSVFILLSACLFAMRALRRRYDLVYVHNMPDILVISSLIPRALGAKVILDQHDPMPELMMTIFGAAERSPAVRLIARMEKWSLGRVDQALTVNVACKRLFGSRSCAPEKIGVVMNSPDPSIFPFRPAHSYRSGPHDRVRPFTIMYHGSLVERNGLDLAVEAVSIARSVIPNVQLKVYGRRTPFLDTVMNRVREKRMSDCILYLGPRTHEQLVSDIEACDVGVIPNHRNPFTDINTPTRIFEYLALGKPVIAPRTDGILDYFEQESLLFFESGDAGSLAKQLLDVHFDPDKARETAERGQQVYLRHSWNQERQELVSIVNRLLNGDKQPS
jgi:glycosyltransferase involved in cell wall biosynthesis